MNMGCQIFVLVKCYKKNELVRFEVGDVIRMPANNQNQGKEYCRQL